MKIQLDIADDCVDRVVVAALTRTMESVSDPKIADLFPDNAEISAACKLLIEYYGPLPSADTE